LLLAVASAANATNFIQLKGKIPGSFDPEQDLRAPKSLSLFGSDSLSGLSHEALLYRYETEFDSASGKYIATRFLLNDEYGPERVFTPEYYRQWKLDKLRRELLAEKMKKGFTQPSQQKAGGAIEIQVPFKIRNQTFRRIFGGDRVGLRVSGNIQIDGGLRREKSDQIQTTQNDQANYNFKIDQKQQFRIVGKVGDKVSVEIDQDSERLFDFENNARLEYQGYEDEIIQNIEAGNISLNLPGTQLATFSAKNEGLFGFKTISQVGPLKVTTIASLQKGEKKKLSYEGGSSVQTIETDDKGFVRDQYFFITEDFRENYPKFNQNYTHYAASNPIDRIEVYREEKSAAEKPNAFYGWAIYDTVGTRLVPDVSDQEPANYNSYIEDQIYSGTDLGSEEWADKKYFKKLDEGVDFDYEYVPSLGYIRLRYSARDDEVIAVAYKLIDGTRIGTLSPTTNNVVLQMLKPQNNKPEHPTWDLSWKHVYWVGTSGLSPDDFEFNIVRNNTERKPTNADSKSWLEVFGLDTRGPDDPTTPDGKIDDSFVDYNRGEIHFPDLRPFDPSGYEVNNETILIDLAYDDTTYANPEIYDKEHDIGHIDKNFILESKYSNASANISLGINVLEGSEEIFLNGSPLKKDEDYIIDYLSGQVTILNDGAFDSNANLEINYESGEIFQLDKRTMFGVRLEYNLWEESFIGATVLYFDEKPIEKRVKVGNEPLRNTIWDINTRLQFQPYAMTAMVDALPFIETDEPSRISFEGEIAQVFPNPNSLNNEATGDNDGVAYIDDFEAAKRTTPMGVRRKNWYPASHPVRIPDGYSPSSQFDDTDIRGRLFWYNPYSQIPIKDIWPNREVNSNVPNNTDVLTLDYDPIVNNYRQAGLDTLHSWNGVMRALSAGYYNQVNTKYLEIMMKVSGGGDDAVIYFDMGQISEDVIPNDSLDTEDELIFGATGNGILDEGEDTGLDGRRGSDPPWRTGSQISGTIWTVQDAGYDYSSAQYDWWDLDGDGVHDPGTPGDINDLGEPFSSDNWSFNNDSRSYYSINGYENNQDDEVRYPDSEDLNNDSGLNNSNNFFRFRYRFNNEIDQQKYIKGGIDNEKGWRLIRIPLEFPYDEVNNPSITQIESFRIWVSGFNSHGVVQIAEVNLIGNEWLEDPVIDPVTADTTVYVTGSTINTFDNPEIYSGPPGVAGEIDPITDVRSKEQSLVIQILDMPSAREGQLIKSLYRAQDLREYKQLKMFVHGDNAAKLAGYDLEMFLRFGSGFEGANLGYYEYSQKLQPGWNGNSIVIDLDQLTSLKKKASDAGEDSAYEVLANGDVIKVVGTPSIGTVQLYSVGVRNFGRPVLREDELEVWVDELRLSGVRKENGLAMRSSMAVDFADFMSFDVNMRQQDANFHQVDQRSGSDRSSIDGNMSANMDIGKFFDPSLGIKIPLKGSVSSNLAIPKYTSSNGDIRSTSLVEDDRELNVWKRYGEMALSKDHYQDKYLLDDSGNIVVDTSNGVPFQDLNQWGVDTLFTTSQSYGWNTSFGMNKKNAGWLLDKTLNRFTISYNRSEKYSSSLSNQYTKNFTSSGKLNYSLPIEKKELSLFNWTNGIPVVKKLSKLKFSYLPTKLNGNVDLNEAKQSSKHRNAFERPTYKLNMSRGFSTGYTPFSALTFNYNYSDNAQHIRADSTRQKVFYDDMSLVERSRYFAPNESPMVIIDATSLSLTTDDTSGTYLLYGPTIADSARARILYGMPATEVVELLFDEIEEAYPMHQLAVPWNHIGNDDPRYKEKFDEFFGIPFAVVQRTQAVSGNFRPNLFSWMTSDFNYSTTYTWLWSGFNYEGRSVKTNNSMGANFALKMRQIIPQKRGNKSNKSNPRRAAGPGADGFGGGGDISGGSDNDGGEGFKFKPPNPVQLMFAGLRKLQDIRVNYSQNLGYSNPSVLDGKPDFLYTLGLTGDPGLETVPNQVSFATSNRTDDYRISSGIDWSTRISTNIDYTLRNTKSTGSKTTGSSSTSGFFIYDEGKRKVNNIDIPSYNLRWSGIEKIAFFERVAQNISLEHTYRGSYTEKWEMRKNIDTNKLERIVTNQTYEKGFSPLVGLNFAWKYGIGSKFNYTWKQNITENDAGTKNRDETNGINFSASYTRKSGFRIPLPIWPFKNRKFNNETTFAINFDYSTSKREIQQQDKDFEEQSKSTNWSVGPSLNYKFSDNVTGSARYKYGTTESQFNTTSYQEFGINVNIQIRG